MSRLTDALMVLLGKCTPEGAHPDGNNVDEIVECLAAHLDLNGQTQFLVTVTKTDGKYTADKTFAQIKAAADERKIVRCLCDGSYYDIVSATSNVVRFSRVLHRVSDDATTIAEMSLVAVEINPAGGITVVGRAIAVT